MHGPCYLELSSTFPSSRASGCGYPRSKPHSAPGTAASPCPAQPPPPQHPFAEKKEVPHPGNKGKHSTAGEAGAGSATRSVATGTSPSPPPPASCWVSGRCRERESRCGRSEVLCSGTGITVPLKASELCFYLRDHKRILEFHPSEQGGLQTFRRSLILNTTIDPVL